ncbi:UNKNOWN [Stylonychia lemnae]|uniref:Uncharacterized protein n=1 Tax=Stylonychia lemnae TaxID=5949 RepID=A0A078ACJ5_STYLE|nr:UNKNOWN [Stylonychia lemnae]|eukprot:CDW79586.1 UNKNOWN [Stylonychia lemnae]
MILSFIFITKLSGQKIQEEKRQKQEELKKEEQKSSEKLNEKTQQKQAEQNHTSFKQLKTQSKGGKKKVKGGNNPEHENYVAGFKGFNSSVVDFDYYDFGNGTVLFIVAEESSVIKAVYSRNIQNESEYIQQLQKLQSGQNILSVSLGPSRVTDSKSFTMIVAVAIFDHCSVVLHELSFQNDQIKFTNLNRALSNIHKIPVKTIRLSKKQPNLMVSCGDESDVTIKLWNISTSSSEPITQISTSQIKHKYMTQGQEFDFYAVAAKTTDTRIYQVVYNQGVLKGSSKYCVTTAKDQQLIVYSIDEYYKQAKVILSQQITSLDDLTLSTVSVVTTSKNITHLFLAIANGQNTEVFHGVVVHDMKPVQSILRINDAQLDNISQIQFFYDIQQEEIFLITSARQDFRLNIWKMPNVL